jgi:hypothetical protein
VPTCASKTCEPETLQDAQNVPTRQSPGSKAGFPRLEVRLIGSVGGRANVACAVARTAVGCK